MFPLGFAGSLIGFSGGLADGISVAAMLSAVADLVSLGAAIATVLVFRSLVKATYRKARDPGNVTPLSPRSSSKRPAYGNVRKAA
ncbi:hypothetical protein SAMN04488026_100610 [Aliiruegeria lutimaris]|uniref:Uncharacterized protein n=1 Tax=Aliiruegeria lutimaris TaxID=571298 RepID=A0A1G8MRC7_9RHOB|nr:hypothetical protein SAMN04488026_100610 [Aliiruegeria lutimaris]